MTWDEVTWPDLFTETEKPVWETLLGYIEFELLDIHVTMSFGHLGRLVQS